MIKCIYNLHFFIVKSQIPSSKSKTPREGPLLGSWFLGIWSLGFTSMKIEILIFFHPFQTLPSILNKEVDPNQSSEPVGDRNKQY